MSLKSNYSLLKNLLFDAGLIKNRGNRSFVIGSLSFCISLIFLALGSHKSIFLLMVYNCAYIDFTASSTNALVSKNIHIQVRQMASFQRP